MKGTEKKDGTRSSKNEPIYGRSTSNIHKRIRNRKSDFIRSKSDVIRFDAHAAPVYLYAVHLVYRLRGVGWVVELNEPERTTVLGDEHLGVDSPADVIEGLLEALIGGCIRAGPDSTCMVTGHIVGPTMM